jgi:hypothetical protein
MTLGRPPVRVRLRGAGCRSTGTSALCESVPLPNHEALEAYGVLRERAARNESRRLGFESPVLMRGSDEREARMFLMGLGVLLVIGGVLYMARATIWRGSLSRPARDTLEPPRRGVGFLGFEANWPGILLMAIGAILLVWGVSF